MSFLAKNSVLIGALVTGVAAGLAFAFPSHAEAFVGGATTVLAALHIQRPVDAVAK